MEGWLVRGRIYLRDQQPGQFEFLLIEVFL
jgi:hypothetical protein